MLKTLRIDCLEAMPGEKVQGFVNVYNEGLKIPVTLINGNCNGKTVLITAGVHGGEYPCIQAAIELAGELNPEYVSGQIIIVHPVNTQAFKARSFAIVPEDKRNLNREFPGDASGSITQKMAHFLTHQFQSKADFYMDLHGGDLHETVTPFVYYPGICEEEVTAFAKEAAAVLDVRYMVKSKATTGAYNSAAIRGVPSLLIERGGAGIWSSEEVEAYKKDVKNVLTHLQILKGSIADASKPQDITHAVYLEADCDGCWYPKVQSGQKIKKGDILGEIRDYFGNPIKTYMAEINGVVLYMLIALSAVEGDSLVAYGEILD